MIIASWGTYEYAKPKVDRTPIWHPFELNSNINLDALVANGYRCFAMPCGQPQFIKTIGDTSIRYDVSGIDCNSYEGYSNVSGFETNDEIIHLTSNNFQEKEMEVGQEDSLNTNNEKSWWNDLHEENPYYPYQKDEIKNCYQSINWRVFRINMKEIDSLWIVDYVTQNGGMITHYQDWDSKNGGRFLVYHLDSDIYYDCVIDKDEHFSLDEDINWYFGIVRTIPHLDQQRKIQEKLRIEKRNQYYADI